jgi:hypothetical protein
MRSGAVSTDQAWAYDPAGKTWAARASLPVKAMNGVAITVGDAIYVGLGYQRTDGSDKGVVRNFLEFYRYDPAEDSYRRLADAPEGLLRRHRRTRAPYIVHGARFEIGHDMNDYGWADGVLAHQPVNTWTKLTRHASSRCSF